MYPDGDGAQVCRNFTSDCVHNFEDLSLDYVYVDARHDYKGALMDMESYWPKIKRGGILAGHDYVEQNEIGGQDWTVNFDGTRDETGRVVKGAVDDFAAKHHRQVMVSYKDGSWPSWAIRK